MPSCLMLDVDGVVVTGRRGDGKPWSTDLRRDLGIDPDDLKTDFFGVYWERVVTGALPLAETLATSLRTIAPHVTPESLIDYWFSKDAWIDERVLSQCAELRRDGVGVWLATNQDHLRARYLMEVLGLAGHVDGIVYSAQVQAKKPDRAFFLAAEKQTGFGVESLTLVDDTLTNVAAARNAGWKAFHWTGAGTLSELI